MLSEHRLYLGDNGRCFCGALRCAGMTAFYTGRDLSGQRVAVLPWGCYPNGITLRCEGCGKEQSGQLTTKGAKR